MDHYETDLWDPHVATPVDFPAGEVDGALLWEVEMVAAYSKVVLVDDWAGV